MAKKKTKNASIGEQVVAARGSLTQDTLAVRAVQPGGKNLSLSLIKLIEQGKCNASGNSLIALCKATGGTITITPDTPSV